MIMFLDLTTINNRLREAAMPKFVQLL